jgi:hypothetical protein
MKTLTNLAREPFRNRRLFWLAIILLFAIPAYLGLRAIQNMARLERDVSDRTVRVKELEDQLKRFEKPAKSNTSITTDRNRELAAAYDLIARRTFSWSQLLNDIERNLHSTVRILRVTVTQIQGQDREGTIGDHESAAILTLDVIGKSGKEVTAMMNRFHESGRFKVSPIQSKPIEGIEDVEFKLKVEYFPPRPATRVSSNNQVAENKQ